MTRADENHTHTAEILLAQAERRVGHWIDGALVEEERSATAVHDPATGEVVAAVLHGDAGTVDRAVQAGARAFPAWAATPVAKRVAILRRFAQLLERDEERIVDAICREHGKVREDAAGEVARGLEVVDLACSAPVMLKGEFSDDVARGVDTYSLRQPLGVCAGITPFNFPAMVPLWMFPVALVCGNAFVLKPSERDPSASLVLAELLAEAGLPAGVFNVVQGDRVVVDALLDHAGVAAVSFVGSSPVARYVYERAASTAKRVQALGGAKNHLVVLPDADLDRAADALVGAAFGSTGQRCMAISVAVAVGDVAEPLIERLRLRADALRIGPASDAEAQMGPLVNGQAKRRVVGYIERGVTDGARLVRDGRADANGGAGHFVGPTIVDGVAPGMAVYDDEIFGPVLGVARADSLEAAIQLINDNAYGNGAAIFTESGSAARRFQREVQAGMIGINIPIPVPVGSYSFGGWKDSLFGDQHLYGPEGFAFYTRNKVVTARWPREQAGMSLAFPSGR